MEKYDFSGWATRNDLLCADGRTIRKDAFKANDGQTVPLVWNHNHNDPDNILGHALLENREEGVYAYCTFNESDSGIAAKEACFCFVLFVINVLKDIESNLLYF